MSTFTKIPCEIIISVLRELGNIRFLLPSLLTCRYVYSCFKENPRVVADILERQIPSDIIPYSVALLEASRLSPRNQTVVHEFLETLYTQPSKFAERLRAMPIPLLMRMGHIHEVIHNFATDFASSAWTRLSKDQGSEVAGSLVLSPSEYLRFYRAFYRVELYFCLFRTKARSRYINAPFDEHRFFSSQPPWEKEQLACVHDFLELELSKASRDVLAHDVEFGELGIDYIRTGDSNYFRQIWLSQGVDFIHRLMSASSYEVGKALLHSAFDVGSADLIDALTTPLEIDLNGGMPLCDYSDGELEALFPPPENRDIDKGPFKVWRVVFSLWPPSEWNMLDSNAEVRERAYVFWDLDRIEKYGMLELFENPPEGAEIYQVHGDFDEMHESFEERSKIWQRGGSGYWSKNDESRIVWPTQ
ncbi:hypothetical protein F5Y04DRAFT_287634 [Hypomontagnella monticulosa]|nr:hypothetical protein F5Y04DRAFT_287634 [Hypomontagnella monticulosa]